MQDRVRAIAQAVPAPVVGPAVWMTLLLFLMAVAMMGCEPAEDFDVDVEPDVEEEEPEDENDDNDNGEEGSAAADGLLPAFEKA